MKNCAMCGSQIPDDQNTCSMCYGDIDHGTDGYYRDFMERGERSELMEQEENYQEDEE